MRGFWIMPILKLPEFSKVFISTPFFSFLSVYFCYSQMYFTVYAENQVSEDMYKKFFEQFCDLNLFLPFSDLNYF